MAKIFEPIVGSRLKCARMYRKLTREETAARVFISDQTLYLLEAGRIQGISILTLMNLCTVLHISADYLIGLNNDDSPRNFAVKDQKFAARLRQERFKKGMTQHQFEEFAGITRNYLHKYELSYHSTIMFRTLRRICSALNLSADYLIGLTNERRHAV